MKASLAAWPVTRPENWSALVDRPETEKELSALRQSILRGRPFGSVVWTAQAATDLGLESSLRARGRP